MGVCFTLGKNEIMTSDYEKIIRAMREQERRLAPILDFENLYGHGFRSATEEFLERERRIQPVLPDLSNSYQKAIESLQPELDRMKEFNSQSMYMESVADAHSSLSRLLSKHPAFDDAARVAINMSADWQKTVESYSGFCDHAAATELALKSHYVSIAESAFLARERLFRITPESFGTLAGFAAEDISETQSSFLALTSSYRTLMQSFEENEFLIPSFSPIVSIGPSIEIFTSANTLEALSSTLTEESESQVERNLKEEIEASLDELLAAMDPEFQNVWSGAKKALDSDNPDRMRHVVTSLRELVTHVLHHIAPNKEITRWTVDPTHFHDGRPTRAARILYICRGINHGPFSDFISADVKAAIECINLFQRGTHELCIAFSEHQVKALVVRTESLLRFLLLIHLSQMG